jgi:hypothetical protein
MLNNKPRKNRTGLLIFSSFLFLVALSACKKEPLKNLSDEESRIYISNYDTAALFETYQTFSIEDSVNIIRDDQSQGKQLGAFETNVIAEIRKLMKSRGYTEVDNSAKPDLAINVSRVTNTSTGVFSYPDYWDSYGGFYDPYYWGYPGYDYYAPYLIGIYTIQNGGLEIDLLDLKNATANDNKIKVLWTGLARGAQVFSPANAATEVNALFDQSAYLKSNN